ncbi:MAG: spore coat associated protein CotJA [Clostridia bacterium]|nr:spore coat associated protein CotJA [Clostridia bacterium]MBQ1555373.1 spore coat associated protein CotJA [Clostridia bacterium]MBQ4397543.1 spore coat associated protein CotJA [Clostridia bacterium]
MVFITCQTFGKQYNEAEALQRGTLFPALDKPFLGRGCHCR